MIEKMGIPKHVSGDGEFILSLCDKLNEIIETLNNMKKMMDFEESHNCITNAAKKAAMSGSLEDLQEYLKLRRKYK